MLNRLHVVGNNTSAVYIYEFNDLIRVVYHRDDARSEIFLDASHLERIKKYKSANGVYKYAVKHSIAKDDKYQQKLIIDYAKYICQSDDTPTNDSQESNSCPVPAPAPAKSAVKGQGIFFIDVETTGTSSNDEIVEIAVVDIDENVVYESLVKPSKPIPKKATDIHGITNAMVLKAPSFAEIWHDFSTLIINSNICFYNAKFDKRMIYQSAIKAFGYEPDSYLSNKPSFDDLFTRGINAPNTQCLMTDYAQYWGEWNDYHQSYKWQSLVKACRQQKIPINDIPNHRAAGDAIKTARLYKAINKPSKPYNGGYPLQSRAVL